MSKKIVEREIEVCDVCGEYGAMYQCMHCKKDFCYDCQKTAGKSFPNGIAGYSKTYFYCHNCTGRIVTDLLYNKLQELQDHSKIREDFQAEWESKRRKIEAELREIEKFYA